MKARLPERSAAAVSTRYGVLVEIVLRKTPYRATRTQKVSQEQLELLFPTINTSHGTYLPPLCLLVLQCFVQRTSLVVILLVEPQAGAGQWHSSGERLCSSSSPQFLAPDWLGPSQS